MMPPPAPLITADISRSPLRHFTTLIASPYEFRLLMPLLPIFAPELFSRICRHAMLILFCQNIRAQAE